MTNSPTDKLKIRGISYLSYVWDGDIPLMVRQQFISDIINAGTIARLAQTLISAGMTKDDLAIMLSKVLTVAETQNILKIL